MTAPHHNANLERFGLTDFPCPGWSVLDAARSRHFTGELTCATTPITKIYFDAGRIYFAQRLTDPSLSARLVDSGALTATQLELGAMFVEGVAHLGRLFDRVGSVDRDHVLLITELMTEDCVGWLASQSVDGIDLAPYRHHPTGIRRWSWPTQLPDSTPTESLPPQPTGALVPPGADAVQFPAPAPAPDPTDDADRPQAEPRSGVVAGVGRQPSDPDSDSIARFEVIWPSGEVDDQVVLPDHVDADDDDPTGMLERAESHRSASHDRSALGNSVDFTTDHPALRPIPAAKPWMAPAADAGAAVALAVRRAVATIETGSLDARRRFVATPPDSDPSRGAKAPQPPSDPIAESIRRTPTRSVFDEGRAAPVDDSFEPVRNGSHVDNQLSTDDDDERVGALRRLIDSMRRG